MLSSSKTELVTTSGSKIQDLLRKKEKKHRASQDNSIVYAIPCGGCESQYFGETGRSLDIRLKEHRRDLQHLQPTNAIVSHLEKTGHLPKLQEAKPLHKGLHKTSRKALEAAHIACQVNHNQKAGSFAWSRLAANAILQVRVRRMCNSTLQSTN